MEFQNQRSEKDPRRDFRCFKTGPSEVVSVCAGLHLVSSSLDSLTPKPSGAGEPGNPRQTAKGAGGGGKSYLQRKKGNEGHLGKEAQPIRTCSL